MDIIEDALSRLMQRPDGAFVIFEDRATKAFLQFAGAQGQPLLLDLPTQGLEEPQRQRAAVFFEELGGGMRGVGLEVFQADLGRDAQEAARQTRRAFERIYGLSAPDLELTEG